MSDYLFIGATLVYTCMIIAILGKFWMTHKANKFLFAEVQRLKAKYEPEPEIEIESAKGKRETLRADKVRKAESKEDFLMKYKELMK